MDQNQSDSWHKVHKGNFRWSVNNSVNHHWSARRGLSAHCESWTVLLGVGLLQQGAPELPPLRRVDEHQLSVFDRQPVVDHHVHPLPKLPELRTDRTQTVTAPVRSKPQVSRHSEGFWFCIINWQISVSLILSGVHWVPVWAPPHQSAGNHGDLSTFSVSAKQHLNQRTDVEHLLPGSGKSRRSHH